MAIYRNIGEFLLSLQILWHSIFLKGGVGVPTLSVFPKPVSVVSIGSADVLIMAPAAAADSIEEGNSVGEE